MKTRPAIWSLTLLRGFTRAGSSLRLAMTLALLFACVAPGPAEAGPYVTNASGTRWNDVSGVRWNDASGVRWNDASGVRWNDASGVRWNDASGLMYTDSLGVRWNDASGVRWNDASSIEFVSGPAGASIDLELLDAVAFLPDSSSVNVIVTYRAMPTAQDLQDLNAVGILGGTIFRHLPIVVVNATRSQMKALSKFAAVRSLYANRTTALFDDQTRALIGIDDVAVDADLRLPPLGGEPTGAGVTIATLDTGVDASHPDLPYGPKVVENVRLNAGTGTGIGFHYPIPVEGVLDSDLILGHGTFVASVAAGTGAASAGQYRGVAPGAQILALSAGDLVIVNMLEGFDYVLDNASRFGVRIVNCSWGTNGWFDPNDPVNVATKALYDAGISVVFAAGNEGPAPDTMNPYAIAPWVIGVGSVRRDGTLSEFSSRGIFEELLDHPLLVAPGEGIIAAQPVALGGVNGTVGVVDPSGGATVPPAYTSWYAAESGTSFAAPQVAGVIALMLQENPSLTPAQIRTILQATATPMLSGDRSDVGAGRVDAWAAVTQARYLARPFGTHVAGWLDARPYRVEHLEAKLSHEVLPTGGSLSFPIFLQEGALSWELSVAWGTVPGSNDLDVRVRDTSGNEIGRSTAFNGTSLFSRNDGLRLTGTFPRSIVLDVTFKNGSGTVGQDLYVQHQTAVATLPGYPDTSSLPTADREIVTAAVARHVMQGRGSVFDAASPITRGETARALALASGAPQRIPSVASFFDAGASRPDFPYIESAAGDRAHLVLMDSIGNNHFRPDDPVDREDFTVAVVRAAGRESEAFARAGALLPLADAGSLSPTLRGYVSVALDHGLIAPAPGPGGPSFLGSATLSRLDASRYLIALLDDRRGAMATASQPAPAASAPPPGSSRVRDREVAAASRARSRRARSARTVTGF